MLIGNDFTVTYCMNIFPVYDVQNLSALLDEKIPGIMERFRYDQSVVPLGLWFPLNLLEELRDNSMVGKIMERHNQRICTLNAFPQGQFHQKRIKEKVYFPDWEDEKRLAYTCKVIDFASKLPLTPGIIPVSTVPITFGSNYSDCVLDNLEKMCSFLERMRRDKGIHFRLLLEPEPGCTLDRISNTEAFLKKLSLRHPKSAEYIGICIDTCHCAVMHENPADFFDRIITLGFSVDKIQISSALKLPEGNKKQLLKEFDEETYLHQTTIRDAQGQMHFFDDLGEALVSDIQGETRTHFHIPLHSKPVSPLRSTTDQLDKDFFRKVANGGRILEIETYTFSVLPDKETDVITSIVNELNWLDRSLKTALED
ncbi:metabolite traffic protein EboE [bacterium]|nr:metabolite traffic protein EboE [bacterium]